MSRVLKLLEEMIVGLATAAAVTHFFSDSTLENAFQGHLLTIVSVVAAVTLTILAFKERRKR